MSFKSNLFAKFNVDIQKDEKKFSLSFCKNNIPVNNDHEPQHVQEEKQTLRR